MDGRHELLVTSAQMQPQFSNQLATPQDLPQDIHTQETTTTESIMSSHFALALVLAALVMLSDTTSDSKSCSHRSKIPPLGLKSLEKIVVSDKAAAETTDEYRDQQKDI